MQRAKINDMQPQEAQYTDSAGAKGALRSWRCKQCFTARYKQWRFHIGAEGHSPPPTKKIVARPPNLAVLLTHCDQLILGKISKFDAIGCHQIFRLKCTKFDFRWGFATDPVGGAHNAPPDSLAVRRRG